MQVRIHIPSHSIFPFFIFYFCFFFFCPCTLGSSALIFQWRSKCSLTNHCSHSNDRKRNKKKETTNVQALKTLCLSGAPQMLPRIRVLMVLLRSQGIQDRSRGSHNKFSQTCTNNGTLHHHCSCITSCKSSTCNPHLYTSYQYTSTKHKYKAKKLEYWWCKSKGEHPLISTKTNLGLQCLNNLFK